MRSVTVSLKIPHLINDNREKLKDAAGAKSFNAMMVGMCIYAMYHGLPHTLTNAIMSLSEEAQDEVIQGVVKKFLAGATKEGNFFKHTIHDAVETVAAEKDIPEDRVVSEIIASLRKAGKEGN